MRTYFLAFEVYRSGHKVAAGHRVFDAGAGGGGKLVNYWRIN